MAESVIILTKGTKRLIFMFYNLFKLRLGVFLTVLCLGAFR